MVVMVVVVVVIVVGERGEEEGSEEKREGKQPQDAVGESEASGMSRFTRYREPSEWGQHGAD